MKGAVLLYEGDDAELARLVAGANRPAVVRHRGDIHEAWSWADTIRDVPPGRNWPLVIGVAVLAAAAGLFGLWIGEPDAAWVALLAIVALVVAEAKR